MTNKMTLTEIYNDCEDQMDFYHDYAKFQVGDEVIHRDGKLIRYGNVVASFFIAEDGGYFVYDVFMRDDMPQYDFHENELESV